MGTRGRARRPLLVVVLGAVLAAVLAGGAWAGAGPGAGRWQADASRLAAEPKRIISLVPALTEMLFAIGAGPQVAAVSSYDDFPEEAASRPKVGALLDPDVERIFSLSPDLVALYGSQTDLRRQLERASIRTYDYRHAGLADVLTTLRDLGRVTGHMAEAERVAESIEQRLTAVSARAATARRVRTLLVFGREPGALRNVYVAGGRGFLHDMLVVAGGDNVFADVARESVQATTELILARAPEVVIELREGPTLTDEEVRTRVAEWARLASVPAVKNGRVHILSGTGLVVPGPRVAAAVERLADVLHPWRRAP
ncbi:MAG: ABC transporter substrate-binding protein [Acidobacteria bacterium]|nr:ABC transporter substrate-binding protein [Acidobacteriota bacterium]